jgi:hypothetical protein
MSLYDLRAASVVARNTGSASPKHALAASPTTMTSTRTACTSTPVAASLGLVNRLARAVALPKYLVLRSLPRECLAGACR